MKERIACLIDPDKWESIFIHLADMLEAKDSRSAEFIKRAIIEPLEKIVTDEFAKHEYSGICTEGIVLLTYARKAIEDIGRDGIDPCAPAWDINHWWKGFYREVAKVTQEDMEKVQNGRRAGGVASGESRNNELQERNQRIVKSAQELVNEGKKSDCVSILSKRYGLSTRQIRNILKKTEMN